MVKKYKKNIKNSITPVGQSMWKKAKKLIPGGNMLISKQPERQIPDLWPPYYKKAKGCKLIDYDGNKFTDCYMGVGPNVLGYANSSIDNAVKSAISKGNMSSLNSFEEVLLAEKLIEIDPTFSKVRFARTGGEANSIAVRIARAASGKENIAICGYHGWHDWYLSANLNKKDSLDPHLISNLKIDGVPKNLKNTTFPFLYGDYKSVKKLVSNKKIGVIKMEVCRNTKPDIKFLKFIRNLCNKKKIVLIFDECTTGFRENYGGLYLTTGIRPDMVIYGKALGNGYPITAIVGKSSIMNSFSKTFISSTFWTERSGSVAALKTLEIMKKINSPKIIKKVGKEIMERWKNLFMDVGIEAEVRGIPSFPNFNFKKNNLIYKTFISQEFLKNKILASNQFYPSICHDKNILKIYFKTFSKILARIKYLESKKTKINEKLISEVCHSDFKRLN